MLYRSMLELYEDILESLACKPQDVESLAFSCAINCVNLTEHLSFLVNNNVVAQRRFNSKNYYILTRRGNAVIAQLNHTKNLQKLKPKPLNPPHQTPDKIDP